MTASVEIISQKSPAYKYMRFNPHLRKIGLFLDRLFSRCTPPSTPISQTDLNGAKVLILESHLIGDAVMTLALVNSLKIQAPSLQLVLCGQAWMADILPDGLVNKFVPLRLPWVGAGKFKPKIWIVFLKALLTLKRAKVKMAVETRGDWRNFMIFWLMGIPVRIGSPMTGGRIFLTHPMRLVGDHEPLWATRSAALELFGLDCNLKLPMPPTQPEMPNPSAPYVVVHPGASQQLRQINDYQLQLIGDRLKSNHARVIVATGRGEEDLQSSVQEKLIKLGFRAEAWSGSLRAFLGLCQGANQVFAMDSGPAHLADWAGAKLTIFCNHDSADVIRPIGKS
jgi:ADP-heptose:LPS heptosyltransferase